MPRLLKEDYFRNFLIGFAVAGLPLVAFGGLFR